MVGYASIVNLRTDASRYFTANISGLADDSYSWWVKGPSYLATGGKAMLTGAATTSLEMVTMEAGDANNDNRVGIADFNILKDTYGMQTDLRADFNNDQVINISDFSLLRSNFGLLGAPPVNP